MSVVAAQADKWETIPSISEVGNDPKRGTCNLTNRPTKEIDRIKPKQANKTRRMPPKLGKNDINKKTPNKKGQSGQCTKSAKKKCTKSANKKPLEVKWASQLVDFTAKRLGVKCASLKLGGHVPRWLSTSVPPRPVPTASTASCRCSSFFLR